MRSPRLYQRLLALVLCCAMLLPLVAVRGSAAEPEMIQILDTAISIPVYSTASGTVSAFMEYDCGNGLKGDGPSLTLQSLPAPRLPSSRPT